ncbi:DUF4440 domain-containing protein [Virgibacillus phasianinus]|uniref:DUF4440 domain-containing protein n=1 Tax=Virgibacillus phasianinus TaxID=2017483 RepID=A0A220TYG1_9BACI|nr:SgcJ/EcaC family oxidoreductase [Virgibacillus phasianinus]ASK61024.1 DUF4440 domain-containing protein [Virgibacillus phasianinus]
MTSKETNEVKELYQRLIHAWNNRNANGMAQLYTNEGDMIGFDGSLVSGREEIFAHLKPIFEEHPTPPFVYKVKGIRQVSTDTAILRAIVGMVPPGETELDPSLNAHQTLVAVKEEGKWSIELFQNTPAQFHGRPELVKKMTNELSE